MHNNVGLVVVIPTSPSSSKTESGCKRYHRFRKPAFLLARLPVDRMTHRPVRFLVRSAGRVTGMPGAWSGLPDGSPGCPVCAGPNAGRNRGTTENRPVDGPVRRTMHRPVRCHVRWTGPLTGWPIFPFEYFLNGSIFLWAGPAPHPAHRLSHRAGPAPRPVYRLCRRLGRHLVWCTGCPAGLASNG
jgi:hypothetical protein